MTLTNIETSQFASSPPLREAQPQNGLPTSGAVNRIASIDVYRGIVMFLMLAEILHLDGIQKLSAHFPSLSTLFDWIHFNTTHVEWSGCSLHDMIQPSFSFLVGTALAFSYASRVAKGQEWIDMFRHAILRSFILIFLGIFLRSLGKPITNFTFDDTLTQIGMGYWALFLVASLSIQRMIAVTVTILVLYWAAFALFPLPSEDFPYATYGVPSDWPHLYQGFAAHWNKNSNLAWYVDTGWMNLFPREKPFPFSPGGYCTLSFVPTLATMILGLIAGRALLQANGAKSVPLWFLATAIGVCCIGWVLDHFGICPIVKRIWTPSWVLWSGGICFAWLAVLHYLCDHLKIVRWAFLFLVIGSNSIVAYVMSWTLETPIHDAIHRHVGFAIDRWVGEPYQVFVYGAGTLMIMWLMLFWLYRQKIFVRI